MNHAMVKLPDSRIDIDAYPQRALFEGVINALAHRDYFLDGTQIQIDMFKDRIEISSPGSFYQGEKISKTYDLSNIISMRRNELICKVFVKCEVMEAAGTGFDKIIADYAAADENHKPYIFSSSDHFTLVLPDLTYADGIKNDDLLAVEVLPTPPVSDYDEKILSYCSSTPRKAGEISKYLGISDSSYFRSKILEVLVKTDFLITEKQGNAKAYMTNIKKIKL